MARTLVQRRQRIAARWLRRYGRGLPQLDPFDRSLLAARLAARRRSTLLCAPPIVLAVLLLVSVIPDLWQQDPTQFAHTFTVRYLVSLALIALAVTAATELSRRADARILAELADALPPQPPAPLVQSLGRPGVRFVVAAVVVQAGYALALTAAGHDGWLTRTFLIAIAVTWCLTGLWIWRAGLLPTLAVGPASLSVDLRLRANGVLASTTMLALVMFAFSPDDPRLPSWLRAAWTLAALVVEGFWILSLLPSGRAATAATSPGAGPSSSPVGRSRSGGAR